MNLTLTGDDSKALASVADWLRPVINVYPEVFNRQDPGVMEELDRLGILIKVNDDPIDFLERKVFGSGPVGFILPSRHARSAAWSRVWGYVRTKTHVIRVRGNPVDATLPPGKHFLDPDRFRAAAERHERTQNDLASYFNGSAFLDLLDPNPKTTRLDCLPEDPPPRTDVRERLENLDELVEAFKNHPYSRYLR